MKSTVRFLLAAIFIFTANAHALDKGDKVPGFGALDQNGKEWKSSDYAGKKNIVVYFYPAAMTGGCTKQACAYRDDQKEFDESDTVVVGVSGDDSQSLKHFETAEKLNFTLLADTESKIAKAFGVPTRSGGSLKRTVEGKEVTLNRTYSAARWTFVIDKQGKLVHKDEQVNAAQDSAGVLDLLKTLK